MCREYSQTIHLLLTDVVIPGIDGTALVGQTIPLSEGTLDVRICGRCSNAARCARTRVYIPRETLNFWNYARAGAAGSGRLIGNERVGTRFVKMPWPRQLN